MIEQENSRQASVGILDDISVYDRALNSSEIENFFYIGRLLIESKKFDDIHKKALNH